MGELTKFAERTLETVARELALDNIDSQGNGHYNEILVDRPSDAMLKARKISYPAVAGMFGAALGPLGILAGIGGGAIASRYSDSVTPVMTRAFEKDAYPSGRGDEYSHPSYRSIPRSTVGDYAEQLRTAGYTRSKSITTPRETGPLESAGYALGGGVVGAGTGLVLAQLLSGSEDRNRNLLLAGLLGTGLGGTAGYLLGDRYVTPALPAVSTRESWVSNPPRTHAASMLGIEDAII